ncbi:DUF6600 domain-containing protein [Paraburkholderia sp.]|uniref:DUF6600 domain-containing protein n=1 Tax=Paraburkholderia sp. TaxID=1926495 RepID=UPI0023848EC7|nr:DUF6600 domain-containing protein [Paraburkholderia sp.]MDE1183644.1 FecR protein [Paraburkholderia sp.]
MGVTAAVFALIAQTVATQPAMAQEAPPVATADASQAVDPPGRIARLNYMAGTVTTEPAGASDWSYAQLNRPLTTGDQVWNDRNARSEMHIGSTAVRLGASTSLDVLNLDDSSAQLKVAQGTLSARVRELPPGAAYEIDTPNLALGLNGPGDYRVDVAPDGSSTTVTVRNGSATVYGDNAQVPVAAGQQIRFAGTNLQQIADNGAPGPDPFDQWVASRDAAEDRSVSARYVSRDIPGYQDLDANGTWRETPQYGQVWTPNAVPAGWSPYHDGHWAWQAPWGWTWVDDAPWGFAPYHYGRWAQVDNAWAWVPGPMVADAPPVYAPALVAFVGDGGGGSGVDWGVSLAIGGAVAAGVAWFPLGPGEPWHPRWGGYSPRYYDAVNRYGGGWHGRGDVNVTNINVHNTYINYRQGAVTAIPATAFVHGQPAGRYAQRVDPRQWHNAQINPGGPGIAPVKGSFGPGMRTANFRPPSAVAGRPVIATRNPATPAAYRDNLAQRFANAGGRVPGAGQPIVRTNVPAHFAGGFQRGGATPAQNMQNVQNVRVVQSHLPGGMPGAAPRAPQQSVAGVANGRPGQPEQPGQHGQAPQAANGVPHPPQAERGNAPGFAQQHGAQPGQPGPGVAGNVGQAAPGGQRHEPAWTQPHTPMAQQPGRQGFEPHAAAQPGGVQMGQRPPQQQAQRAEGNPGLAQQQARQQQEAQRAQQAQQAQQHAQQTQQAPRPAEIHAPQTQQAQRPQPQQQPRVQPQSEAHVQPQPQQQRPQPQQQQARQEFHPQPQVQQPRPQPQPQQARQESHPQQQQQPHPQPQQQPHPPQQAQQHSNGGHDEHHHG